MPSGIDPLTVGALLPAWLESLAVNPRFYNTVEFEIALARIVGKTSA